MGGREGGEGRYMGVGECDRLIEGTVGISGAHSVLVPLRRTVFSLASRFFINMSRTSFRPERKRRDINRRN